MNPGMSFISYNDKSNFNFNTLALCQDGDVRLAGGSYNNIGRIDLCINGTWGTICSNTFDNKDASVVCRQLGYSSYGKLHQSFHPFVFIWLQFSCYFIFKYKFLSLNCSNKTSIFHLLLYNFFSCCHDYN